MAIIIAATTAGLIDTSTEAIKPSVKNNSVYHERLVSGQEFNSLEKNDQSVILAKIVDSRLSVPISPRRGEPSNFPTPPAGSRTSRPVYITKYRPASKVVPVTGLGAAANPAGDGNGDESAEFYDYCPAPNKEQ